MNLIAVNPGGILIYFLIFAIIISVWLSFRRMTKGFANYTEKRGNMSDEISDLKNEVKILNEKLDALINK